MRRRPGPTLVERRGVRAAVDRLLGLRIDLADWYNTAAGDARLRPLADTFRGMKPPRFPTMFEAVVNAFACQQLSLEVGLELLNRLSILCSARFGTPPDARYGFPRARDVTRLTPGECRAIGFSHQKVRALLGLASAITRRELDLESIAAEGDAESPACSHCAAWAVDVETRCPIRPRTPCTCPGDDVGAQKRLAAGSGVAAAGFAGVSSIDAGSRLRFGVFHLLLDGLPPRPGLGTKPRVDALPTKAIAPASPEGVDRWTNRTIRFLSTEQPWETLLES